MLLISEKSSKSSSFVEYVPQKIGHFENQQHTQKKVIA
jgi:hypothetical protein